MLVSAVLDYIFLAIPFNLGQTEWQVAFVGQMVDQGIRPLVGLCLLALGYWVGSQNTDQSKARFTFTDPRFWAIALACILGLFYLLFVPVHLNNSRVVTEQGLQRIQQQASQAEAQLQGQFQQLDDLLKNEQRYKQLDDAIKSNQVQGDELARLQALKAQIDQLRQNPQALTQQFEQAKQKLQEDRQRAESQARSDATKSSVRTALTSLLLAIAYALIGWTGIKSIRDGSNA
jgi:acyl carrier protein phosphodiesterase